MYNIFIKFPDKISKTFKTQDNFQTFLNFQTILPDVPTLLCVHVCRSVCLMCMCVGRSALCVDQSALSVHVCRSVCIVCACVWAGLHCVCMCVGLSALCVGRSALCVGRSALYVGRSALCVGVDCANFVNLYEIKLNQIVVLPLHGAGENVISYLVQPH